MTRPAIVCLALLALTAWLYAPVVDYEFVNFDDPGYVTANAIVQRGVTGEGTLWAFSTFEKANWHPLTWLSHMLDVQLFGISSGAHHVMSVVLHAATGWILFGLLWSLTRDLGPSALVAALFIAHPLHVESVAWISERKDVLSGLFWVATLWAYAGYARRGGIGRYLGAWTLLALGLTAKPMLVTLPFVLLLLDVWPLGRTRWAPAARPCQVAAAGSEREASWWNLVREKIPFFALSIAASLATLAAQRAGGAMSDTPTLPLLPRLENAAVACVWYLEKAVWPTGLAALYPHPSLGGGDGWGAARVLVCVVLLGAITAGVLVAGRRKPYLLVGWLWYLGTLVPVSGLIQVGQQAMADRYSYLPLIGPFLAAAWGLQDLTRHHARLRVPARLAALVSVTAYALVAREQLAYWRDAEAVAERAVVVTRNNFVMHYNLAFALFEKGELEGAIPHYAAAVRLRPNQGSFHGNLAVALAKVDRIDDAMKHYRRALELEPADPAAYNNLAWLLATHPEAARREPTEALRLAQMAHRLAGNEAGVLDTLAAAQASVGQLQDASRTAQEGAVLARQGGREELARAIERRVALYQRGLPYREEPRGADATEIRPRKASP